MRALERLDELSVVMRGGAQARSFELEREPRERVREHVVHLTRETLALTEHRGVSLRLSVGLELAHEALRTLLSLREPSGEPGDDEERDDAEHLQRRIEDALALAGDLGGRQRDDCERDERNPRRAADAQGCCGNGDEGSEERRPLRLHRGEGGRAEDEHRKGRHLRGCRATGRGHDGDDADGKGEQRQQDPEVLACQSRPGPRPGARDLDDCKHGPAERKHRAEHLLL